MTKEQEEAISTMQHWIDYEKRNKDKIQKADELINIQETILSMLKEQQEENKKKDKIIDLMTEHIVSSAIVDDTVCAIKCDCETDIEEDCTHEKMLNCTKQYFENKAKE